MWFPHGSNCFRIASLWFAMVSSSFPMVSLWSLMVSSWSPYGLLWCLISCKWFPKVSSQNPPIRSLGHNRNKWSRYYAWIMRESYFAASPHFSTLCPSLSPTSRFFFNFSSFSKLSTISPPYDFLWFPVHWNPPIRSSGQSRGMCSKCYAWIMRESYFAASTKLPTLAPASQPLPNIPAFP